MSETLLRCGPGLWLGSVRALACCAVAAFFALQPVAAQEAAKLPCADADTQCAQRVLKHHAASRIDTWRTMLSVPLAERIGPAPPHLVEFLKLDNILNGYAERPRAATLDAGLLADIRGAIADLPAEIWKLFGERLVGVYFVEGLGGTGYSFFNLSWIVDREADKYRSRFDASFPQRTRTVYYFGARLAAADMVATYASLKLTNFPSLYAATAPGDDFAESFASYVHVVLMRRPWQITISRDGKPAEIFRACWGEPRCAQKQKLLEQLVGRASW